MPRNMSFMLTTDQVRGEIKHVTRRNGWDHVKPGEIVQAVEKCQGIPEGGHVTRICLIQILSKRWERIDRMITDREYGLKEVALEGFPDWTPEQFVDMYCKHNKKKPEELCNRIRFEYV